MARRTLFCVILVVCFRRVRTGVVPVLKRRPSFFGEIMRETTIEKPAFWMSGGVVDGVRAHVEGVVSAKMGELGRRAVELLSV